LSSICSSLLCDLALIRPSLGIRPTPSSWPSLLRAPAAAKSARRLSSLTTDVDVRTLSSPKTAQWGLFGGIFGVALGCVIGQSLNLGHHNYLRAAGFALCENFHVPLVARPELPRLRRRPSSCLRSVHSTPPEPRAPKPVEALRYDSAYRHLRRRYVAGHLRWARPGRARGENKISDHPRSNLTPLFLPSAYKSANNHACSATKTSAYHSNTLRRATAGSSYFSAAKTEIKSSQPPARNGSSTTSLEGGSPMPSRIHGLLRSPITCTFSTMLRSTSDLFSEA